MATQTGRIDAGDVVVGRFTGRIRSLWLACERIVTALENRYAASRYLGTADERMLHDIGLTRADVDAAFSQPLWVDPTQHLGRILRDAGCARTRED